MPYRYTAYGLVIESPLPLPGGVDAANQHRPDICLKRVADISPHRGEYANYRLIYRSPVTENDIPLLETYRSESQGHFILKYFDGNTFLVDIETGQIHFVLGPKQSADDLADYLFGPVLSLALRFRGVLCLHASAVIHQGCAIVVAGESGAGKSTVAASFAKTGHHILSDDIAAIERGHECWQVLPGYPRMGLWRLSVESLFDENPLQELYAESDKIYTDYAKLKFQYADQPCALGAIYILKERSADIEEAVFESISPRQALMEMVQHKLINRSLDLEMHAQDLETLGKLINTVPIRYLTLPNDLSVVSGIVAWVVKDYEKHSS